MPTDWPRLAPPCLMVEEDLALAHAELCMFQRSRAVENLEDRLQQAMFVYVGGDRSERSPELVLLAVRDKMGITSGRVSVQRF